MINCTLAYLLARASGSIVNLVVSFYTVYVAGALLPMIVYVMQTKLRRFGRVPSSAVLGSIIFGGGASLSLLLYSSFHPLRLWFGSRELSLLLVGFGSSVAALVLGWTLFDRIDLESGGN